MPLETAAQHLVRQVPRAAPTDQVANVLRGLVGTRFDSADAICVVEEGGRLVGLVGMRELLCAEASQTLAEIMNRDLPRVLPSADQEHVATEAIRCHPGDLLGDCDAAPQPVSMMTSRMANKTRWLCRDEARGEHAHLHGVFFVGGDCERSETCGAQTTEGTCSL